MDERLCIDMCGWTVLLTMMGGCERTAFEREATPPHTWCSFIEAEERIYSSCNKSWSRSLTCPSVCLVERRSRDRPGSPDLRRNDHHLTRPSPAHWLYYTTRLVFFATSAKYHVHQHDQHTVPRLSTWITQTINFTRKNNQCANVKSISFL